MCVWFPLWPVQRLQSERSEPRSDADAVISKGKVNAKPRPLVLYGEGRRGLQVVVCSTEATKWGIRSGMPLGEAQSLLPCSPEKRPRPRDAALEPPILERADPEADRRQLQALALHCYSYSPLVGLEECTTPESIWLDISGSETLFGGEQSLAKRLIVDMGQRKLHIRIAVADSWGTAWAVSHFGKSQISVVPTGQQSQWLSPLPIAALRLTDEIRQSLKMLNVMTIGQLLCLPRASLPSRFGKELLRRINQALCHAAEMLIAERPVEPLFTEWLFDEPIADRQTLDHVCEVLLERLLGMLDQRRAGLRELACYWRGTAAEPTFLRLLRPTTDRRHLFGLLRLQCERRVFTTVVHGVRMEVVEMGIPLARQGTLFGDDSDNRQPQALAELVDRLSLRLGRQAVLRPRLTSDPQPEYACESVPWLDQQVANDGDVVPCASRLRCRPLRLLATPQPLAIQSVAGNGLPSHVNESPVSRIRGPERIETGWWRGPDVKRDYYCLDLTNGVTLWAFMDRETGRWFLHGLFV